MAELFPKHVSLLANNSTPVVLWEQGPAFLNVQFATENCLDLAKRRWRGVYEAMRFQMDKDPTLILLMKHYNIAPKN